MTTKRRKILEELAYTLVLWEEGFLTEKELEEWLKDREVQN
jgi:hypothetical protein